MFERCIMLFPGYSNIHVIDRLRSQYDPLASLVRPHITLVFPFKSNITLEELMRHIGRVLVKTKPFDIKLQGIVPNFTGGNYLFLNVVKGDEAVRQIHDKLYTGILEEHYNKELPYSPHLTIGQISDESKFEKAIIDTRNTNEIFETYVDKVSVEIIGVNGESNIEYEYSLPD